MRSAVCGQEVAGEIRDGGGRYRQCPVNFRAEVFRL
jgi:hypothetical protein